MATPSPSFFSESIDDLEPLDDLERRIERTLELFASLKRELSEAQAQLAAKADASELEAARQEALAFQREAEEARAAAKQLREQLKASEAEVTRLSEQSTRYKSERQQVRQRVEKLLGQMDLLTQGNS